MGLFYQFEQALGSSLVRHELAAANEQAKQIYVATLFFFKANALAKRNLEIPIKNELAFQTPPNPSTSFRTGLAGLPDKISTGCIQLFAK